MSSARRIPRIAVCVIALVVVLEVSPVYGPPVNGPTGGCVAAEPDWRETRLPVEGRDLAEWVGEGWAGEEWSAIATDRWERFREAVQRVDETSEEAAEANGARLERVVYEATFSNAALVEGRVTARMGVPVGARAPILVSLAPLDLPLRDVRTGSRPAVWGAVDGGGSALLVSPADETMTASWELAGRRVGRDVAFDLRLARATVSTLRIRLPGDHELSSDAGIVERDPAEANMRVVTLGSRRRVSLRVSPVSSGTPSTSVVVVDRRVRFGLQPEGIRFRAEFDANALRGSLSALAIEVPVEARVESATYGDVPLPFSRLNDAEGARIELRFTDAIRGAARTVTLTGTLPLELGNAWTVPQFGVVPARPQGTAIFVHDRGTLSFDVARQLDVEVERSDGLRRIADDGGGDERSLAFSIAEPGAQAVLIVSYPDLVMQADVVSVVDTSDDVWSLRSAIRWRARSGRAFGLRVLVPRGWRIADVFAEDEVDATRITGWHVDPGPGGAQVVTIDLLGSLGPKTPRTLFLDVRFETARTVRTPVRPVIRPLDCESADTVLIVEGSGSRVPDVVAGPGFRVIDREELTDVHRRLADRLLVEPSEGQRVYRSRSPGAAVVLTRPAERRRTSAVVRVQNDEAGLAVVYELSVEAGEEPIALRWTASEPPREWTVDGQPDVQVVVEELPGEAPLPQGGAGEAVTGTVWQYRPMGGATGPVRLVATRPIGAEAVDEVPLPFTDDGGLRATIRIPAALLPSFSPRIDGAIETAVEVEGEREWTYTDGAARLSLARVRAASEGHTVGGATVALRTLAGMTTATVSEAVFTTVPEAGVTRFDFSLPSRVELVDVHLDGRRLVPTTIAIGWRVPLVEPERAHEIAIRYRRGASAWLRGRLAADVPVTETEVLGLTWEVVLPREWLPVGPMGGVRLVEQAESPTWRTRLFGPLGREASIPAFNPLQPSTWWPEEATGRDPFADRGAAGREEGIPAGWRAWVATAPSTSGDLALVVSNEQGMRGLAWSCLLVCLAVGGVLRGRRQAGRTQFGVGAALVLFAAGWLVPGDVVIVLGGAIAGIFLAFCLPRALVRRSDSPAAEPPGEGSTMSFRHVATGAMLIVLLTVRGAASQEAAADSANASRKPVDTGGGGSIGPAGQTVDARVLIPEPRDGSSSEVVYLSSGLLARLEAFETRAAERSRYLLQRATYETRLSERGTPTVVARYRVVALVDERPIRLELPLRGANPGGKSPCVVNGRDVPIESTDDPNEIVVLLTDALPDEAGHFDVEFALHPPVVTSGSRRTFSLQLPRVVESRFVVTLDDGVRDVVFDGVRGNVERGGDARVTATLGPVGQTTLTWTIGDEPVARPRDVGLDVHVLATVAPAITRMAAQLRFRSNGAGVDEVAWDLPATFAVSRVAPSIDAEVTVVPTESGSRVLLVPRVPFGGEEFTVDLEWVVPPNPTVEGVRLPALEALSPRRVLPEHLSITRSADRLGIVAGSAFRVRAARLESDDALRNLAVDAFRSSAEGWGGVVPEFACVLESPAPLVVELVPRMPVRTTRQRTEYRLAASESTWSYEATVDVGEAPVFGHRLELPADVVVGAVSVMRDDVERVRGWDRRGDVLSIDLDDRAIGRQRVDVTGWLPMEVGRPVLLPPIRLLEADTGRAEVVVRHAGDVVATIVEAPRPVVAPSGIGETMPGGDWTTLGRFEVDRGQPEVRVRIEPRDPWIDLTTLTTVEPPTDAEPRAVIRTRLRIDSPQAPWGRLGVRIPPGLELRDVVVDGTRVRVIRSPDGTEPGIVLVSRKPTSARAEATLVCVRSGDPPGPREERLVVEVPGLVESVATERHWMVLPEGYEAVGGAVASQRDAVVARFPDVAAIAEGVVIVAPDDREPGIVRWELREAADTSVPRIVLLEHRLVLGWAGVQGTTLVHLAGRAESIRIDVGEGRRRRVRSVVVDGRTTDTVLVRRTLVPPLDPAARRSLLRIDWTDAGYVAGLLRTSLPLPRVLDMPVDRTMTTLLDEAERGLRTGTAVQPLSPTDFALEHLEGLLEGSTEARSIPTWLADEARTELERVTRRLDDAALDERRRERRDEIEAALDRLVVRAEEVPSSLDPEWNDDVGLLARIPSNSASIVLGVVPRWPFLLPVPLLLLAGLWWLGRRSNADRWTEPYHAQPSLPLLVAGVVWWVCLRASGMGLVLILAATILLIVRPKPTREERSELVV